MTDNNEENRTVRKEPLALGARASFRISVVSGPSTGASLKLEAHSRSQSWIVGSQTDCDLQLDDSQVSRRHLSLELDGAWLKLTDLGSTNGTRINGVSTAQAVLSGGEQIEIGDTTLRLSLSSDGKQKASVLSERESFGNAIGQSEAMRRIYPLCEKLAASSVSFIISGETGTGKEVFAEAIHAESPRKARPFVIFDCTTVAPNLVEPALFGHERGAFTGATGQSRGVFEQADTGTLLIDEIGDLDLPLQAKLLRAIERSEIKRVGGEKWIKVDVRIVAATRRDLKLAVKEGRFRDDLYFRLAIATLELPPLRARSGDIEFIARALWQNMGGNPAELTVEALRQLAAHDWPGNARELKNAIARMLALGDLPDFEVLRMNESSGMSEPEQRMLDFVHTVFSNGLPLKEARQQVMDEFERVYLTNAVSQSGGNIVKAASQAGVAERYFRLLRARHGLSRG
jgi:two-component system, NtrC family, response regulator HydG